MNTAAGDRSLLLTSVELVYASPLIPGFPVANNCACRWILCCLHWVRNVLVVPQCLMEIWGYRVCTVGNPREDHHAMRKAGNWTVVCAAYWTGLLPNRNRRSSLPNIEYVILRNNLVEERHQPLSCAPGLSDKTWEHFALPFSSEQLSCPLRST